MSCSPVSLSEQGQLQSQIRLFRAWHFYFKKKKNSDCLRHGFLDPPKPGFEVITGPTAWPVKNRILDGLIASKMLAARTAQLAGPILYTGSSGTHLYWQV